MLESKSQLRSPVRPLAQFCDGVTFLHKSRGRPTRGTTTPPRPLPPGTPAAALLHRRTDADRPPIPKTSHGGPTRDHSVPVRYYLILIPSRQILPSHRQDTLSLLLPAPRNCPGLLSNRSRPGITSHRTGQHVTFHAFTSWLLPPARTSSGGRPPSTTDPHTPPPASLVKTPPPQPGSAQRQMRCRHIRVTATSTGQAPSWRHISQPIDYCRCRPTRWTGEDPSGGVKVSGCQHLVVSWHSVGLRTRFPPPRRAGPAGAAPVMTVEDPFASRLAEKRSGFWIDQVILWPLQ